MCDFILTYPHQKVIHFYYKKNGILSVYEISAKENNMCIKGYAKIRVIYTKIDKHINNCIKKQFKDNYSKQDNIYYVNS